MENIFQFRKDLISDYRKFSTSFTRIKAPDIKDVVDREYANGRYWPEALIQLNCNYERAQTVEDLVSEGLLHPLCDPIFRAGPGKASIRLFKHQMEAISIAQKQQSYVVTTGTGSGKSLSFFIPIVDHILRAKESDPEPRTLSIIIYPMNALANSQHEEINKFLGNLTNPRQTITVERYTGQEDTSTRQRIANNPPDILLTNYMMLELILTRYEEVDRKVVDNCSGLSFLVLDELHTYRGRQGADVAMLVRRLQERLNADKLLCIGTSATMSSTGSREEKEKVVSDVASLLFGQPVSGNNVIGETLERCTDPSRTSESVQPDLRARIRQPVLKWDSFEHFQHDPLAIWVELNMGLDIKPGIRPVRAKPISISTATERLALDSGCDQREAREALESFLVRAQFIRDANDRAPFAFKLHQFISGPGKVHCTLDENGSRVISLDAQRFAPNRQEDNIHLFSTHFCRDCGQEFHPVWRHIDDGMSASPRDITDVSIDDDRLQAGFLAPVYPDMVFKGNLDDYPESWIDHTAKEPRLKADHKGSALSKVLIDSKGRAGSGRAYWFIPGMFRFCPFCGQLHEAHGRDSNRLSGLSGEGRSSATTMLSLSAITHLYKHSADFDPNYDPRKLLGFSDNRQDAALQAGHFNDFLFLLMLRAGLIAALKSHGGVLTEENLGVSVFKALGFDSSDPGVLAEYLSNPTLLGPSLQDAQRAARFVIGYRLIRDLRKGWRYNNPNLGQLDLLEIGYSHLSGFCADSRCFAASRQPPGSGVSMLQRLSPDAREALATLVFGEMIKNLCVDSPYLSDSEQEKHAGLVSQRLTEKWSFADDERLDTTRKLVTGKQPKKTSKPRYDLVSGGARSRLIRLIKNAPFWKESPFDGVIQTIKSEVLVELLESFLRAAERYGFVESRNVDRDNSIGWILKSSCMEWRLTKHKAMQDESQYNAFFRDLYLATAQSFLDGTSPCFDFEAHEHTAQVDSDTRKLLESRFRYSERDQREWLEDPSHLTPLRRLPVMFCSPTMELGVDIASLNTVFMRNVPPTPANYAQRSGRAGRSGQAALVITYCASMSPHDQWFFHNAENMVHGVVKAPTLDLANRELIESHLNALWLANTRCELPSGIASVLDTSSSFKPVRNEFADIMNRPEIVETTLSQAERVLARVRSVLLPDSAPWYDAHFTRDTLSRCFSRFSDAFERWRKLFDAVRKQIEEANRINISPATSNQDRDNARRRYQDATNQYNLLLKEGSNHNNDFYLYRYLASQGFLPGYNFPRLPLMAWIPSSGGKGSRDKRDGTMVSRPRFLALSEFGPRSLIYHQGRMFRVFKVKLNVSSADQVAAEASLPTITARICSSCGYGHLGDNPAAPEPLADICEHCGAPLEEEGRVNYLYRVETVETRPEQRISVNEEERQRQGFDLQTTYRFMPGINGQQEYHEASLQREGTPIARLTYSPSARIWRINKGWRRRKKNSHLGFFIDPISGTWSKEENPDEQDGEKNPDLPTSKVSPQRVVPYVEDYRNILIFTPSSEFTLSNEAMATLQSALLRSISRTFQIEDSEMIVEPLPNRENRKSLLFYEASEGGAGVLSRLVQSPESFATVAREALRIMHYQIPPEGSFLDLDLASAEERQSGQAICEAGCYQCLLSYFNQPDHELINRRNASALDILQQAAHASVVRKGSASPSQTGASLPDSSGLAFADYLTRLHLKSPDQLSVPLNNGQWTADALYRSSRTLVFSHQPSPELQDYLLDRAYTFLVIGTSEKEWETAIRSAPELFGTLPA